MKRGRSLPPLLALFQKRVEGDDALLELARLRFSEAGLGAEFYAETPEELGGLLAFRPPGLPAAAHLGRGLDLFSEEGRRLVLRFARAFRGEVMGLVVHDQPEAGARLDEYVGVLRELERALGDGGPLLFVEYAAHLDRRLYLEVFRRLGAGGRVGACVDAGHLGLRRVREAFEERRPGEDVFALSDERAEVVVDDLNQAVASASAAVVEAVAAIGGTGRPIHLHLHDGHPLAGRLLGGLADHHGFLETPALPGGRALPMMFGLRGLRAIAAAALGVPAGVSMSLEVHDTGGRLPLRGGAGLFSRWTDLTNAERMNHWLDALRKNHLLLLGALGAGG
ncbi:MAG: hypothetical protein Kow0025_09040 [Thermodesulfovibrionales bacterium]